MIKNVQIVEHFTNTALSEPHTFGEYLVELDEGKKVLVIRNDSEWKVLSHYVGEPIKNCLGIPRKGFIDELIEKLN